MKSAAEIITPGRVAAALAFLLLAAFPGPVTGLETFIYRDFGVLAWPTAAYHHEMFWRGELPLWNPYSNCGVPFLAQWGTMALYPFSLIYLLLPLPWSLNIFCLAHLWWGGVGMYRLAERWTGSRPGAALASVFFIFNGLTLASLFWPNYTAAFAWMPWVIYFTNGKRSVPLAVLTGTMQMLSGVPELIALTWIIAGTFLIYHALIFPQYRRSLLVGGVVIVVLIAGLSAMQLLPFFELLSYSHRQGGVSATKWALPLSALPNFGLPMLHAFPTGQGTWYQYGQHFLSSTYLGLTGIALAGIGVWKGKGPGWILGIASVVAVVLAMGPNLPTFALVQKIPLVGLARYPVKFALLLAFTAPLLAGFGVRALGRKAETPDVVSYIFAGVAGMLGLVSFAAIFWVKGHPFEYDSWPETYRNCVVRLAIFAVTCHLLYRWARSQKAAFFLAAVVLIFVDGRFHLANQNPTVDPATLRAGIQERGLPKLGEGRVFISPAAEDRLLKSAVQDLKADFIGKQLAAWSHLNLVELIPKVNGSATLAIREQREVQDQLYGKTNTINLEKWLDDLSVTRVTAPQSVVEWTHRTSALPLVRFEGDGRVAFIFREHEVIAHVSAKAPGDLVIAQTWYPAWRWNGRPVKKSHGFLQAVELPGGESVVELHYRPPVAGTALSFLSLAACCGLLWLERRTPA